MIFNVPLVQTGAGALLALAVTLILTGRLVPRAALRDVREDRDKAVARALLEAETWRRAYEAAERARQVDAAHVGELLEAARTTSRVLTALPVVTSRAGEPDATATI